MRRLLPTFALIALLSSCSDSDIEDHELDNEKIFGTVVSMQRTDDVNWAGAGHIARTSAGTIGNAATGGLFNNWWSKSAPTENDVTSQAGIAYVIETEEGKRIKVLASFDRIYYPGEEVMVIQNGAGYSNVYPRDMSHKHPGGL